MNNKFQKAPLVVIRPTDWRVGGESGATFRDLVDGANWDRYLPTREKQKNSKFDSNFCATYSGLNVVETLLNYHIANGEITSEALDFLRDGGYMDENDKVNFNEVYCAKLNGTTIDGNNLGAIWMGIHDYGLIPQKDWKDISQVKKWEDLMEEIPAELLAKGKKFKDWFEINFEWCILNDPYNHDEYRRHLKQSPLHVAAPVCPGWNSGDVKTCDITKLAHATMRYGFEEGKYYKHFDHYNPYEKKLEWSYYVPYAVKAKVTVKDGKPAAKYKFLKDMRHGETSEEVRKLQERLKEEGTFALAPTGYYGDATARAVFAYQVKKGIKLSIYERNILKGKSCGPKTREVLNAT